MLYLLLLGYQLLKVLNVVLTALHSVLWPILQSDLQTGRLFELIEFGELGLHTGVPFVQPIDVLSVVPGEQTLEFDNLSVFRVGQTVQTLHLVHILENRASNLALGHGQSAVLVLQFGFQSDVLLISSQVGGLLACALVVRHVERSLLFS